MWMPSTDWNGTIERSALTRILLALAAMAGLVEAAGFCLPRDIYRAVLRPLRLAEDAARCLPAAPSPIEAARLMRRFTALARAIYRLARRLMEPVRDPIRRPAHEAHAALAHLPGLTLRATERRDTS